MHVRAAILLAALLAGACAPAASNPSPVPLPASPSPLSTPPSPSPAAPAPGSASPTSTEPVGLVREVRADVPRADAASTASDARDEVVAGDTALALRLYAAAAAGTDGALFISPYSISTALSMTYAGARADTAAQLAGLLGVTGDAGTWHAGRNALDLALVPDPAVAAEPGLIPLQLESTNALFGQDGFPIEDGFLTTLASDYGAGMQVVDFATATEPTRQAINAWVAARTRDRIKELLGVTDVSAATRLVLVNAIFFKAGWMRPFDPEQTKDAPFHLPDGSTVAVPMMHGVIQADYAHGEGWQAVRLPYLGASMLVIVPDTGTLGAFEAGFTPARLAAIRASLRPAMVTLSLPRWTSSSRLDLKPVLQGLGVSDLFDARADLSGISTLPLVVSAVIHEANVTVDEHGTEAAAATAVGFDTTGGGPDIEATVTVDRPFIYLIQDDRTGETLFLGRLMDPASP